MTEASDERPFTKELEVRRLDLDPLNPRLIVGPNPTQVELLEQLYEQESLDELVHSFLENGYFSEEPLVVVPNGSRFTVVEGNRRLATLKLLLDSDLRRKIKVGGWPSPTSSQSGRLRRVPCVVYKDRSSVLPFLGFRHITGAKKWGPYQKARFVAQLLESGQSISAIEDMLGDDSSTIKKLYQQYVVFQQMTQELDFGPEVLRGHFSYLEVALGQRPIKRFLGMSHRLPTSTVEHVVDDEHLDELNELGEWIFGTSTRSPLVGDSREINSKLAKVLDDDDALTVLRETGDLTSAVERLGGEEKFLLRRVNAAERALRDVLGLLPLYRQDRTVVAAVERVLATMQTISRLVEEEQGA